MVKDQIVGILLLVGLYVIGSLSLLRISANRDRAKSNIALPEPSVIIKCLMLGFIFILVAETLFVRFC